MRIRRAQSLLVVGVATAVLIASPSKPALSAASGATPHATRVQQAPAANTATRSGRAGADAAAPVRHEPGRRATASQPIAREPHLSGSSVAAIARLAAPAPAPKLRSAEFSAPPTRSVDRVPALPRSAGIVAGGSDSAPRPSTPIASSLPDGGARVASGGAYTTVEMVGATVVITGNDASNRLHVFLGCTSTCVTPPPPDVKQPNSVMVFDYWHQPMQAGPGCSIGVTNFLVGGVQTDLGICPLSSANHIQLRGGGGDDELIYERGGTAPVSGVNATVRTRNEQFGDWGNDTLHSGVDGSYLDGGPGNDVLFGVANWDQMYGGPGDDYFAAGGLGGCESPGHCDDIGGGDGWDEISYISQNVNTVSGAQTDPGWPGTQGVSVSLDDQPNDPGGANVHSDIESVVGTPYADTLQSGATQPRYSLEGRGGRNTFISGPHADQFIGGPGTSIQGTGAGDVVSYQNAGSAGVSESLTGTSGSDGDTLFGIEAILGSAGPDILVGDGNRNLLVGAGDGDVLDGNGGNDLLCGDRDQAPQDNAYMVGTPGRDWFYGYGNGTKFFGGGSDFDTLSYEHYTGGGIDASLGSASVDGYGPGGDIIDAEIDNLIGTDQVDKLRTPKSATITQRLYGHGGDDTFYPGEKSTTDVLVGDGGFDTVTYANWTAGGVFASMRNEAGSDVIRDVETLIGTPYDDTINGDDNANWIYGGNGSDHIDGYGGDDHIFGEVGGDELWGGTGSDALDGGTGDDTLHGEAGDDTLDGGNDNDILDGGDGADHMAYEPGNDTYEPGSNIVSDGPYRFDVIDFSGSSEAVAFNLGDGTCNDGPASEPDCMVTPDYNNRVVYIGGYGDDTFRGDANPNYFVGGPGDDQFWGHAGADWFIGDCGDGFGICSGPGRHDAVRYDDQTGNVIAHIDGLADSGVGGSAEGDMIGTDIEDVWSGSGNDTLYGNSANNTLVGNDGNDKLYGYLGADTLDGGEGDDTLYGYDCAPANEQAGSCGDYLDLPFQPGSTDGADDLYGGWGDDHLFGQGGRDRLFGGLGDDELNGGVNDGFVDVIDARDGYVSGTTGAYSGDVFFHDHVNCGPHDEAELDDNDISNTDPLGMSACDPIEALNLLTIDVPYLGTIHPLPLPPGVEGRWYITVLGTSILDQIFERDATWDQNLVNYLEHYGISWGDARLKAAEAQFLGHTLNVSEDTVHHTIEYVDVNGLIAEHVRGCVTGEGGHSLVCSQPNTARIATGNGNDEVNLHSAPHVTRIDLRDGDDRVVDGGTPGSDIVDGGLGNDTVVYDRSAGSTVSVTLLAGGATTIGNGAPLENDGISNVENVAGGAEDDTFRGTTGTNTFDGGGGFDTVSYADHASTAQGVNVTVPGPNGTTTGNGMPGENDTLKRIEAVFGGAGNDTINGTAANDTIGGGTGTNDVLNGNGGNDTLSFADRNPFQPVTMTLPPSGSGTVTVAAGGNAAAETANYTGFQNVTGGAANDTLTGNNGPNALRGNGGNDTIDGAGGADVMNGGNGDDTITYASRATAVNVSVGAGANDGETINGLSEGDDVQSSPGTDTVIGTAQADTFTGDLANQHFVGGGGDDTMNGGDGADIFDGGSGYDKVVYTTSTAVNVAIGGTSSGGPAQGDQVGADVEEVDGGSGNDLFTGTTATQKFDGGAGVDTISYLDHVVPVKVALGDGDTATSNNGAFDATSGASTEHDVLVHIENAFGGSGNDDITGNGGPNTLAGGPGNDTLHGGNGDDTLLADTGNDTFYGDGGTDTASYVWYVSPVTARLSDSGLSTANGMSGENDSIDASVENLAGGQAANNLEGNAASNVLTGGPTGDTLVGDGGLDALIGNAGNDRLYGDAGPARPVDSLGRHTLAAGTATSDWILGGPGNDTIDAVDGNADAVNCGDATDTDTALIDASLPTVNGTTVVDGTVGCENIVPVGWTTSTSTGITGVKSVSMSSPAPGQLEVVFTTAVDATHAAVKYAWYDGSKWLAPIQLTTKAAPGKAPAHVYVGSTWRAVTYTGTDQNVYLIRVTCTLIPGISACSAGSPRNLGHPVGNTAGTGATAVASLGSDAYVVFAEGPDQRISSAYVPPKGTPMWVTTWSPTLGANLNDPLGPSTFAAVSISAMTKEVLAVDTSGNLRDGVITCNATNLACTNSAWENLGKPATGMFNGTTAGYDGTTLRVYVRDSAGNVYERARTAGVWTGWSKVATGSIVGVPMSATSSAPGRFALGVVDSTNTLKMQGYASRPAGI